MLRPDILFTTTPFRGSLSAETDLTLLEGLPHKRWFIGELLITVAEAVMSVDTQLVIPSGSGGLNIFKAIGDSQKQPIFKLSNILLEVGQPLLVTAEALTAGEVFTFSGWAQQRG